MADDRPVSVVRERLTSDFARFAEGGLPSDMEGYLLEAYNLDVSATYAGLPIRNPWGKASGQLSMRIGQVEDAHACGLGFVILKTVIAQDDQGSRSMEAWAVKEARMVAERIVGKESGIEGWTITWKGRGWWESFESYIDLVREATAFGREVGMLIAPSVKFHLPAPGEQTWRIGEYETSTRAILEAFRAGGASDPMPLEKDFSPTLAGSDRSSARATILEWLDRVPSLIQAAVPPGEVRVGLKLFNALDTDAFQLEMLARVHGRHRPDFLVYANRLFDPDRVFEGHRGVAYGGPDLGDRNLRLLAMLRAGQGRGEIDRTPLEISATGDITSGRRAVAYARKGCTSFQIHTLFQLPDEVYPMRRGPKLTRALHLLYFHPENGFVIEMHRAAEQLGLGQGRPIRFLELAERGAASDLGHLHTEGDEVVA